MTSSGGKLLGGASRRASRRERSFAPDDLRLVLFEVGGGRYAVDIMRIRQVLRALPIVPFPKAPAFVEGVIELRGSILPVVDLRRRFELAPRAPEEANKSRFLVVTIAVDQQRLVIALVVDRVIEPVRLPRASLRPRPAPFGTSFFHGVIHQEGHLYMLLDLDLVLTSSEKIDLGALHPPGKNHE